MAVISNGAFSLSNFRGPLIREMIARGNAVYALAPDYDDIQRAAVRALGATPVDFSLDRSSANPLREAIATLRLWRLLRRLQCDVVFSCFIKPAIYGTLAAHFAGVRRKTVLIAGLGYAFTHDDGPIPLRRRALASVLSVLFRWALRYADTVFFQNADDRDLFVRRGLADPARCIVLNGTGVDLSHFAMRPPVIQPISFILMARLLREKGVYEFVEAARQLKRDFPDAHFILLGDVDSNPGSLDSTTVQNWVDEGVIAWPGQVKDVQSWIGQASVFVLPSWREGAPRSTQEALALGRPVVTTDAPGCRDTVIEGLNGFKVPIRDPKALADAMRRFLVNPGLIAPMGEASRALAEERYDVHAINAIMLDAMGIPLIA